MVFTRRRSIRARLAIRARLVIAVASLLLAAGVARADVIYLSSGGIVKGTIIAENDRSITVKTAGGSTSIISRDEIDRVEKGASPEAMYRERLKKIAPGDAEAHYQLGLWLKKINVKDLAKEEFQKTILLDPEHKFARDELGYVHDTFGNWVLPGEKSQSESSDGAAAQPAANPIAAPAPAAEPVKAAEPESKALQLALDEHGFSPELATALKALAARDAADRKVAFDKLDSVVAEESDRLAAVLLGSFSRTRERIAQSIAKFSPGADVVLAKIPSEGSSDGSLKAELKEHLDAYVEKAVRPSVVATVRHVERKGAGELHKIAVYVGQFIKDYRTDSAIKRREKAFTTWASAKDEAIKTIFDLKIYPDENHGRIGQPVVDEKVDAVRNAWQFLDPQVQRDLGRFLGTPEGEAKKLVALLDEARAVRALAVAYLESKSEKAADAEDVASVDECLLRYRAGDVDAALAMEPRLSKYEGELLRRVRCQRVLDFNDGFKTAKVEKGKVPSAEEMEQVRITNDYRIMQGRLPLEIDPRLIESARGHSQEMTRLGYFEHESPVGANKTPFDRMKNAGYENGGGENISLGSEAPKATHLAWYNSSGHHRNILNDHWNAMGSGKDGRHWTQNFGGAEGALKK